jgi:hypothetical protein
VVHQTEPADTASLEMCYYNMNHTTKVPQSLKATLQFITTFIPYQLLTFNFRLQVTIPFFFFFTISTADDFTPHERPKPDNGVVIKQETRPLPPYNGYGTYEDSAANCRNVIPVPPHRDFNKFFSKDRYSCVVRCTYILRSTEDHLHQLFSSSKYTVGMLRDHVHVYDTQ